MNSNKTTKLECKSIFGHSRSRNIPKDIFQELKSETHNLNKKSLYTFNSHIFKRNTITSTNEEEGTKQNESMTFNATIEGKNSSQNKENKLFLIRVNRLNREKVNKEDFRVNKLKISQVQPKKFIEKLGENNYISTIKEGSRKFKYFKTQSDTEIKEALNNYPIPKNNFINEIKKNQHHNKYRSIVYSKNKIPTSIPNIYYIFNKYRFASIKDNLKLNKYSTIKDQSLHKRQSITNNVLYFNYKILNLKNKK